MNKESINRRNAIKKTTMLLGYSISAATIAGIMNGCKVDPKVVANGIENWTPSFLSKKEGQLVAQIAECIIPKTATPGSIDVGVHSFIDIYLSDNVNEADQTTFKESINLIESNCKNETSKSFLECSSSEKNDFLKKVEAKAKKKTDTNPEAKPFWFTIKELTFLGYFTSEEGAKQFLKYDPIPGNYESCIPLEQVGGTWYSH